MNKSSLKRTAFARKSPIDRVFFKPSAPRPQKGPAPRKTSSMKSKQRAVTPREKVMWSKLAALGCIACMKDGRYNPHVSIHHVDGRTKQGCHKLVLPLCGSHHQDDGSGTIAVHPWKARFEERYGKQLDLVEECMALIGETE